MELKEQAQAFEHAKSNKGGILAFKTLTAILASALISHSCANYNPQVVPYQYSEWGRHRNEQIDINSDQKAYLAAKTGLEVKRQFIETIEEGKELRDRLKIKIDKLTEPCLKERIQRYMNEPGFNQLLFDDPEIIEYISKSCVFEYWDKSLK